MSDIDLAAIRERYERAYQHVADLCDPKKPSARWTMRVPAEPDRDSDLVIGAALDDIPRLLAALDAAEAERDALIGWDERWIAAKRQREGTRVVVGETPPWQTVTDARALNDELETLLAAHRERAGGERTS